MIPATFIGVLCMILQMVFVPQIENIGWRVAMSILVGIGYSVAFIIAVCKEDKLETRINELENRLKYKEELK